LAFLLDILEVPESHTGVALAKAFQQMLEVFGAPGPVMGLTRPWVWSCWMEEIKEPAEE